MKPTLKIQHHLREHGLDATIDKFKILAKPKGNLVLFKYEQLECSYAHEEVQESRGLILDSSNNWDIVCYPFHKFFNIQEGYAHPIDWNTAKVFTKFDGSLISLYFYNDEWNVSTSGVLDASTTVNAGIETFRELVIETIKLQYNKTFNEFTQILNPLYYYMFELCTPKNIVVTQHSDSKLYLLAMRNSLTLKEDHISLLKDSLLIAPSHDLKDVNAITKTFDNMTWQDEGYVVCDKDFNRVKIKNPAYVSIHHLKGGLGPYHIMNIIKSNELDEYLSYFKERAEEALMLKERFDQLETYLSNKWVIEYNSGLGFETQKDFALKVLENTKNNKLFSGLFFNLKNNKTTINQFLIEMENRELYFLLTKQHL